MNKKFFGLFLLTAVSAVSGLCAKDAVVVDHSKSIVVVNLGEISMKSTKFLEVRNQLEKTIEAKVKAIEDLEKTMGEKIASLKQGAKDMTTDARQKAEESIGRLQAELEMKKRHLQAFIQEEAAKLEGDLVNEVRKICKEKGWSVVMPNALYADASVDKTSEVVSAMNAGYKSVAFAKKA